MKIYLVIGDAYNAHGNLVMSVPMAIFSKEDNAVDYILKTWPEVQLVTNETFGVHYEFGPTEDFTWIAKYYIKEMNVEDL